MPVATIGEQSIGQSSAINMYFANEFGLMGSNNVEASQILAINEHLKEMDVSYKTLVPWATKPQPGALDTWFDGGAQDITGMAEHDGMRKRYLTWWLGRIELTLNTNGFAVGNKLSLADVLLYVNLADSLSDEQCAPNLPTWRSELFCDQKRTAAAVQKHPRILASCNTVASHPNIQKWLSVRGVQSF